MSHLVTDLHPIGLAELISEAGMLTRIDRKYVLTVAELDACADSLTSDVAVLEIAGQRSFGYRSTYLDTPALDAYTTAGRKRRRRFKVRTRDYLDTGTSFLEVKTRGPRGVTVKSRIPYDDRSVAGQGHLGGAGLDFVAAELAQARVLIDPSTLQPTIDTAYRRTTLHVPGRDGRPSTRATIDTDLHWADVTSGASTTRPALAIVETKGTASPSVIDRALWRHGHRPQVVSKYGAGMALLRPDLHALKWHHIVTTDLARTAHPTDSKD